MFIKVLYVDIAVSYPYRLYHGIWSWVVWCTIETVWYSCENSVGCLFGLKKNDFGHVFLKIHSIVFGQNRFHEMCNIWKMEFVGLLKWLHVCVKSAPNLIYGMFGLKNDFGFFIRIRSGMIESKLISWVLYWKTWKLLSEMFWIFLKSNNLFWFWSKLVLIDAPYETCVH